GRGRAGRRARQPLARARPVRGRHPRPARGQPGRRRGRADPGRPRGAGRPGRAAGALLGGTLRPLLVLSAAARNPADAVEWRRAVRPRRRRRPSMDLGLNGKVALVTASSKGLGGASALALSQEGAKGGLWARDGGAVAQAAEPVPGEARPVPADVTDPAAPERLVAAAVDRFGGLDVLAANAGGPPPARALEVDDEALLAALQANLLTSIRLVQAALPPMRAAGRGRLCLITSQAVT